MAVHFAGLPLGVSDDMDSSQVLSSRVVRPPPLCGHWPCCSEWLHPRQQLLVRRGHTDAAGVRPQPPGRLHPHCGRHLVVLHTDPGLVLHGKPGGLPDSGEDGHAHRECGWPSWPVAHPLWHHAGGLHHDVLQGLKDWDLPENVAIYGEQGPQCVHPHVCWRNREGDEREFCIVG